ncbi:efflux RND transporter periplasmic adaptor subunit [Azonexus hydrophilus]|uniref:efflux RND transporter periplasmic adaptor subunit n=1 Tax=Azonexus hydrophilus TaxID=418702 RepID=UPI0004223046|nr:HlyD family efflux transporter periplasmic adaptor subunit [Azonexus hydrophilus]
MNMPHEAATGEVVALANLLHLTRRVRQARDAAELAYVAMNETLLLLPYRQAVLWLDGRVAALSGVVSPEANAPYVQWLKRLIASLDSGKAQPVDQTSLPDQVREEWQEWLPENALWIPLPAAGRHFTGGGWLLARDDPFNEGELALVQEWAEIWTPAWALMHVPGWKEAFREWRAELIAALPDREDWQQLKPALRQPGRWRATIKAAWAQKRLKWALGILLVALFPVRLSVLAPGELVPAQPAVLRAPLDGVIDKIHVQPNQKVKAGDLLFEFDRATLASKLAVAEQAYATAEAEYRQFAQQALQDDKMKGKMVISLGALEEKKTEVLYLREINQRSSVTAPRDGVAIFDDPTEWSGRPVSTGEKVMMVAAENDVEIEAWLSPADVIELDQGNEVTLYLNTRPFSPIKGKVRYLAFEAQQRPEGHYAYRLRAAIAQDDRHERAGLKGTAKVNGKRVPAIYWVLRKPLAALRNFVGI